MVLKFMSLTGFLVAERAGTGKVKATIIAIEVL
jgi:hypothetical protein